MADSDHVRMLSSIVAGIVNLKATYYEIKISFVCLTGPTSPTILICLTGPTSPTTFNFHNHPYCGSMRPLLYSFVFPSLTEGNFLKIKIDNI